MNPVNEVTTAAKSAWRPRNLLLLLFGLLALFAIANAFGITAWIIQPVDSAKAAWQRYKAKSA